MAPADTNTDDHIDTIVVNGTAAGYFHKPEFMDTVRGIFRTGVSIVSAAHIAAVVVKAAGFFQVFDYVKSQVKGCCTGRKKD